MKRMVVAALSVIAGASSASAATNEVAELPPIVVEASRIDTTPGDMAGPVQVIAAGEIAESGARDVVDLLAKKTTRVNVRTMGGNNPALSVISMPGYGENGFGRVLVLVDGEPLNAPDMNAPNLSRIPLSAIRQLEIVGGPQTVLYGGDASAGVINIMTDRDEFGHHGRLEVHGGDFESFGASAAVRGGFEETLTHYWGMAGYDHSRGYRQNSQFDIYNLNGGIRQDFGNGSYLKAGAFYNHSDYGTAGYLTAAEMARDRRSTDSPDDFYRRTEFGFNAEAMGVIDDANAVRLGSSLSRRLTWSGRFGSGGYDDYDWTTYAYLGRVDYDWESKLNYNCWNYDLRPEWINTLDFAGMESKFVLGGSYRYEWLESRTDAPTHYRPSYAPAYTVPYSDKYQLLRNRFGVFAQENLAVTEWLSLQLGGRYERICAENTAAASPSRNDHQHAYEGAIVVHPTDDFKIHLRAARFFRTPFLDETPGACGDDGNWRNTGILRPECGANFEIGFDWTIEREWTLSADCFYTKTWDEIVYDKVYFQNNVNLPDPTVRRGFNVGFGWHRDKVASATVSYAYTRASFDGGEFDGNDVPGVPESVILANVRFWLWDECSVFGGYRFQSAQWAYSDFYNDADRLEAFGTFYAGVNYAPESDWLRGWSVNAVVDNVFDEEYCDYGVRSSTGSVVYYPACGRSFTIAVAYEF